MATDTLEHKPAKLAPPQTEAPTPFAPAVLPGDTVWFWLLQDGRLVPNVAILLEPMKTAPGRWVANRQRRGIAIACEGCFAEVPTSGCFTLRKPEFWQG